MTECWHVDLVGCVFLFLRIPRFQNFSKLELQARQKKHEHADAIIPDSEVLLELIV
jgi:hypothetical protein